MTRDQRVPADGGIGPMRLKKARAVRSRIQSAMWGRASGVKFRLTGFCPEGEGNGFPLDREQ